MTKTPLYKDEQILEFIPQRAPFLLIDSVYELEEEKLVTGFKIPKDHVLCDSGKLTEGGLVENIAQSAALFAGSGFRERGEEVPVGYIASIKGLKVSGLPDAGAAIFTTITFEKAIMNIQIVNGTVRDAAGKELASCELRIFIKNE